MTLCFLSEILVFLIFLICLYFNFLLSFKNLHYFIFKFFLLSSLFVLFIRGQAAWGFTQRGKARVR